MRSSFVIFISVLLLSCNNNQSQKKGATNHAYYFFPKANVYFDSTDGLYSYLNSADGQWQSNNKLPDSIKNLLDKKVALEKTSSPVWKDNQQHRLVYGVNLYTSSSDFKETTKRPTTPSKQKTDSIKNDNGSSIERFFKRLFGGKKDKKK